MKSISKVTKVISNGSAYAVELDGSVFNLSKEYGVEPKVGDNVTLHLVRGSMVRGVEVNGVEVFYKTDSDLEREHIKMMSDLRKEQEERFLKNKSQLDADFETLPKMFQEKILESRATKPHYRVEYESYDMFCYKQAVEIANRLSKLGDIQESNVREVVKKFANMPNEEQFKLVPNLNDGHSGNTFAVSCSLAALYLSSSEFKEQLAAGKPKVKP